MSEPVKVSVRGLIKTLKQKLLESGDVEGEVKFQFRSTPTDIALFAALQATAGQGKELTFMATDAEDK